MQQEIWFQKYRILGLLGSGSNAKVYLAEHIKLSSFRAIKCISKNHPQYDLQCKEAFILKNLKHSCIPIIYDIEEDEDGSYIVEQYIEGITLKKHISSKGPFLESDVIRFGLALCDLFEYLHSVERPVLYVDLKPDNIILSGDSLKLIDFGSAVYQDELNGKQGFFGTRGYAAPELYGNQGIDERCEVYGIGMLMYYMATGIPIKSNSQEIDNIDDTGSCSKNLKKIINQCLKYNPSQRYASVIGLGRQLSAMYCKNQSKPLKSQLIKIAVAGAQPRIGVTHLSFRLCRYLKEQGISFLYQEKNSSGCVWSIKNCYELVELRDGICIIEGIPMLASVQSIRPDLKNYCILVQDYGELTAENLPEITTAQIRLLVSGAKDWELEYAERMIGMTAEYKEMIYLFNFLNGSRFQQVVSSMGDRKCYRIPYEPDPFTAISRKNEFEFYQQLLVPFEKLSKKNRQLNFPRKGKSMHEE